MLELADLKRHLSIIGDDDDVLLAQKISAAQSHVEGMLGFAIVERFPTLVPPALIEAVRLFATHLYENREASVVGVSIEAVPGFADIVANHRDWTF